MKRNLLLVAVLALFAAPLPAFAQAGGQGRAAEGQRGDAQRGGMMAARVLLEQGSVEYLVTHAAHLQLTADQTASFRKIGAAWSTATAEARAQIRAAMPAAGQGGAAAGADRQAMMQRMQELRPVLARLTAEDAASLEQALAPLSASQQAEARKLIEQRAPRAQPRRGGR